MIEETKPIKASEVIKLVIIVALIVGACLILAKVTEHK